MSIGYPLDQHLLPPKRLGSPSEEVQRAEHAALVTQQIEQRKKQAELDTASHAYGKKKNKET